MFFNKNAFWVGIFVGLAVPFVGYALFLTLFDTLDTLNIIDSTILTPSFRTRTLSLFSICLNLIPFQLYKKRYFDNSMRGMVFPTILYVIVWIWYFWDLLFYY